MLIITDEKTQIKGTKVELMSELTCLMHTLIKQGVFDPEDLDECARVAKLDPEELDTEIETHVDRLLDEGKIDDVKELLDDLLKAISDLKS